MATLFLVLEYTGGHVPCGIWSIWATREKAEQDMERVKRLPGNDHSFFEIREVPFERPGDLVIKWYEVNA